MKKVKVFYFPNMGGVGYLSNEEIEHMTEALKFVEGKMNEVLEDETKEITDIKEMNGFLVIFYTEKEPTKKVLKG